MSAGAEHQSGKPRNFSASDLEVLQQLPEYVSSMWPGYLSHKFGVCDRLLSRVISELPGASSLSSITQSVNEQASLKHKQRELAFMSLQEAGSKNPFWARVNKARKLARWVWRLHCRAQHCAHHRSVTSVLPVGTILLCICAGLRL